MCVQFVNVDEKRSKSAKVIKEKENWNVELSGLSIAGLTLRKDLFIVFMVSHGIQ